MSFWKLLKESVVEWQRDKASQLAASTAYYTVFSLAPLLIIVLSVVGLLLEEAEVEMYLLRELRSLVGEEGMGAVASMLDAAKQAPHSVIASIIGFIVLILGASGLMAALQDAFNSIWKIETHPHSNTILVMLLKRLFSLGMILTLGFLLLVSLVLSTVVSIIVAFLSEQIPALIVLLPVVHILLSFLVITFLFIIFFKYLPDVRIPWKTVLPGAALTALLFTIGKTALGFFLSQWDLTSSYGVASSIIVLLLWINYSSQVMFLGAEFTKVYAKESGAVVTPRSYAQFSSSDHLFMKKQRRFFRTVATKIWLLLPQIRFTWKAWRFFRKFRRRRKR